MTRHAPRFTVLHAAGGLFLLAGLVLATYHGLAQFDLVPGRTWVSWSHIHFVTIGGFTQLLVGTLPQLTARATAQPHPGRWYDRLNFLALNGAFALLWYGRGWGHVWAFDYGLGLVWLLVAGLLVVLLRMALRSDRGWNPTVGLYLASVFVFLWGISYAYGLFAHIWSVPGGWLGLREAHVHANAWGFLAFAAIATLYALLPRLWGTALYSDRLRNYSVWFLVVGIFPLIVGPWVGLGRSVTASGLVLYAVGFVLYVYNLVQTYRTATDRPALATWVLGAQFWLLGPAGFAPFVLFGVQWVDPAFIEDGALHFFFMGWALPIALVGLWLAARNFPGIGLGEGGVNEVGGGEVGGGEVGMEEDGVGEVGGGEVGMEEDGVGEVGVGEVGVGEGGVGEGGVGEGGATEGGAEPADDPTDSSTDAPIDEGERSLFPIEAVPAGLSKWMVVAWNVAILVVGVGFFYQDQAWSAFLFGPGYTVLIGVWLYVLVRIGWTRRSRRPAPAEVTSEA